MNREMESGPGGENNQPSSEAPITVIDWQTAALQVGSLRPGDLVGGFPDVTKLNLFTYNVGQFLKNKPLTLNQPNIELSRSGKHSYKGWHKSSMLPSKAIKPPKFNGEFEKIAVLMLDDERPADLYGKLRKRFVITADTHTTGKKERGKVAVLCLIGIYDKAKEWFTTVSYKELPSHSADTVAEAILKDSQETAEQVIKDNLRHIFHGGLPGQGKGS